jgi:hypothetical protein
MMAQCLEVAMKLEWNFDLGIRTFDAQRQGRGWVIHAVGDAGHAGARCPCCGRVSRSRKGRYHRRLQDLPVQGSPVVLEVELSRWRCRNPHCSRESFVEQFHGVAPPHGRRTRRVTELARLIGYAAGGRPTERILIQLGLPQSDDTVLRNLKGHAAVQHIKAPPRVVAIDDWS